MAKRYLPFEDANWNEIVEDAFSPDAEVHVFSERYKSRKERLMRKYTKNNDKKPVMTKKGIIAVAAAVAVFAAVPASVYAGTRIYNAYMEKPAEYQRDIIIDAGESPSMEIKALNVGWVPEDMEMHDGAEHTGLMKYRAAGEEERGISILFWKIPTEGNVLRERLVHAVDSDIYTDVNGNTVILVRYNQDWQEKHEEAWVAFKDTPYAAQVYIMGNVSESERVQILENLSLESWNTEVASDWSDAQRLEEAADVIPYEAPVNKAALRLAGIGEIISYEEEISEMGTYGTDIVINDVRIQNTFDGITTDGFGKPYDYSKYTNPDGTVKDNIRTWIRYGDGVNTLDEIVSEETLPQTVVVMDVTYTNTGDIDWSECICPQLYTADAEGNLNQTHMEQDGMRYEDSMHELKTDDMMFSISTDHSMYKNHLDPFKQGETANVQIAFLVNTEDLPNLYLNLVPSGRALADEVGYGSVFTDLTFLAEEAE